MTTYLVIGGDGHRYGPADVPTVVKWTLEGRIVAGTVLIDTKTNLQVRAGELPAVREALFDSPGPQIPAAASPRSALDETVAAPRRAPSGGPPAQPFVAPIAPSVPDRGLAGPPGPPPIPMVGAVSDKSRVVAGLLGILLGWVGAHRFYLGYPGIGILMILLTPACGIGYVWAFIEGILCLTGSMRDKQGRPLRD